MTPEAQRIAIAEALGYVMGETLGYSFSQGGEVYKPDEKGQYFDLATWTKRHSWVPDFDPVGNLNIMHEAEKVLTKEQLELYGAYLNQSSSNYVSIYCPAFGEIACVAMSTASARAEAFLKTLNLWKE